MKKAYNKCTEQLGYSHESSIVKSKRCNDQIHSHRKQQTASHRICSLYQSCFSFSAQFTQHFPSPLNKIIQKRNPEINPGPAEPDRPADFLFYSLHFHLTLLVVPDIHGLLHSMTASFHPALKPYPHILSSPG